MPSASPTIKFGPMGGSSSSHLRFDRALRDCFPDTLLLSPDGRSAPAHRIVLMAASRFFRRVYMDVSPACALSSEYKVPVRHALLRKILDVVYGRDVFVERHAAKDFREAVKFLELEDAIRERKPATPKAAKKEEAKKRVAHSEESEEEESEYESEEEEVEKKKNSRKVAPAKTADKGANKRKSKEIISETEDDSEDDEPLKRPKKAGSPSPPAKKRARKAKKAAASTGSERASAPSYPPPPAPASDASDCDDDEDLLLPENLWKRSISTADATNFDRTSAATTGEYSRLRQKVRPVASAGGVYWRCKECAFWSWKADKARKHADEAHVPAYKV